MTPPEPLNHKSIVDHLRRTGERTGFTLEEERVYVQHWLFCQYMEHGEAWREKILEQVHS